MNKGTSTYCMQIGIFFEKMEDPYLKSNKEVNRSHYYCFKEDATGVYWMIPLSSRVEKYRKIIENKEKTGKPCDILHSVFIIQDMFPITLKENIQLPVIISCLPANIV